MQANTLLQNRYHIINQIGKGGMGTVYVAKDENLGITVAVKQNLFTEQRLIEAFKREARLLASLRHPALPQVKDHFIVDDQGQFLVMEFIAGDDLETILEKRQSKIIPFGEAKPFDVEQVVTWADQLLDVLDYLHTRPEPIIHRDIKPQNLKLAERNQIILLDFGLAKGKPTQMTQVTTKGSLFGYTPNYAPIEQIRGIGTDPRSDLYALGATLYHLITGVPPVDAATRADVFLGGEIDPLRPVNELNPQVSPEIAAVLMKALEQHRNNRSASAAEMLQMLRAAKHSTVIHLESPQENMATVKLAEEAPSKRETAQRSELEERKTRQQMEAETPQAAESTGQQETLTQSEQERSSNQQSQEPARSTTPQQLASKPLNARSTLTEPNRRAKKKRLLIGGISLLCVALAIIAVVLIGRYLNNAKPADDKLKSALPFVADSGVLNSSGIVISRVSMSDDGQTVVAVCDDKAIRLWQPNVSREFVEKADYGSSIALSRDGQTVVTGNLSGTVCLWRASDGVLLKTLKAHTGNVFGVGFSPDGKRFYSTGYDRVKLWRVSDDELLDIIYAPEEGFKVVAVSPEVKLLGFYNPDGRFKLWSIADNSFLRYLDGAVPSVSCGAFSADGQMLAVGSSNGDVQLWQTGDGRMRQSLGKFGFEVVSIAFSADGRKLAVGLINGKILLWQVDDSNSLRALEGHGYSVNSLSFSADGSRLASGSSDSARVWILER